MRSAEMMRFSHLDPDMTRRDEGQSWVSEATAFSETCHSLWGKGPRMEP